jgi:hypothetical protein
MGWRGWLRREGSCDINDASSRPLDESQAGGILDVVGLYAEYFDLNFLVADGKKDNDQEYQVEQQDQQDETSTRAEGGTWA